MIAILVVIVLAIAFYAWSKSMVSKVVRENPEEYAVYTEAYMASMREYPGDEKRVAAMGTKAYIDYKYRGQ